MAVSSQLEWFRETGADGVEYVVRPFEWTLTEAEKYSETFAKFRIFVDDVAKDLNGFLASMMGSRSLWFEVAEAVTGEHVGFIYLTDLVPSGTERRMVSATFHATVWDANATSRLGVAKRFIRELFRSLRLHRLVAIVPLNKGGAIRVMKRLGFKQEGVLRQVVRYNGAWYSALLLSVLEDEVSQWA